MTQHEQNPSSSLNPFNPQASGLGVDNSTVPAVQAKNSEVLIPLSLTSPSICQEILLTSPTKYIQDHNNCTLKHLTEMEIYVYTKTLQLNVHSFIQ